MGIIKHNEVNEALGLPDAKAFEAKLNELLNTEEPTVIASLDVDKFDEVNKHFGRATGDKVLIDIGNALRGGLPKDALLYRFGGDAFNVIFAADCDKESAFLIMEKLRERCLCTTPDGENVTVSIGVAAAPDDAVQYNELVRKAEGAMIRAKVNGHNRVCLAREEKMVVKTSHYTLDQLQRLTKLAKREGTGEAILLREALDTLLRKYDV